MTKNAAKTSKPQLQLKGRIFMQNVTDIIRFARNGKLYVNLYPACEKFVPGLIRSIRHILSSDLLEG
jgi:hypothetical protein